VEKKLENLKKRIRQLKEKRPGYADILDFYEKVKEAQENTKASLTVAPVQPKEESKSLLTKPGSPLLRTEYFSIDVEVSVALFQSLCQIGKKANPHMAERVSKIEEVIRGKTIDLKKLLREGGKEEKIEKIAEESGLDRKVLSFLIHNSRKPSIEAEVKHIRAEIDPEKWMKGHCPICGSPPDLSLLKEEVGKRYLVCSYCRCQWRVERLLCPFCDNREPNSLHYLFGEEEEAFRIDLCEKCHQYIKTIDLRIIEPPDPALEDLATLHLDILASQKGYKRPVPNFWLP
jgi:FdhE protein